MMSTRGTSLKCIAGNAPRSTQVGRGAQIAGARQVTSQAPVKPDDYRRDVLATVAGAQFLARSDA